MSRLGIRDAGVRASGLPMLQETQVMSELMVSLEWVSSGRCPAVLLSEGLPSNDPDEPRVWMKVILAKPSISDARTSLSEGASCILARQLVAWSGSCALACTPALSTQSPKRVEAWLRELAGWKRSPPKRWYDIDVTTSVRRDRVRALAGERENECADS